MGYNRYIGLQLPPLYTTKLAQENYWWTRNTNSSSYTPEAFGISHLVEKMEEEKGKMWSKVHTRDKNYGNLVRREKRARREMPEGDR